MEREGAGRGEVQILFAVYALRDVNSTKHEVVHRLAAE